MATGIGVVVVSTYLLRDHVRKVKQADMKIAVSALLFSFATFWLAQVLVPIEDFVLIPLFISFALVVYKFANRPSSKEMAVGGLRGELEDSDHVPRS